MRKYPSRILCQALTLISLWAACSGCVKRMSAANEPLKAERSSFATIQSVQVSQDGSQVELVSDRPLTYTSYKLDDPPKVIVDLSQTEPGGVTSPVQVNGGTIKQVDVLRQPVNGGVLTRMEISLNRDVDFEVGTDPQDKGKLLVKLSPLAAPAQQPQAQITIETPAAQAKGEEKGAAAQGTQVASVAEPKVEERRVTEEPLIPGKDGAAGGVAPPPAPENAPHPAAEQTTPAPKVAQAAALPPAQEAAAAPPVAQQGAPVAPQEPAPAPPAPEPMVAPAPVAAGQGTPQRTLTSVAVSPDGVDLAIAGGVETFSAFKLRAPDRLVLDLFGVKSKMKQSVVPIDAFGVGSARVGITPDKVRVVLDAPGGLPPFEVRPTENGLRIRFKGKGPATAAEKAPAAAPAPAEAPAAAPSQAPAAAAVAPVAPAPSERAAAPVKTEAEVPAPPLKKGKGALEAVDFKVVDNKARVLLKLAGDCQPEQPVRSGRGISLTLKNCQVPKRLQRALDTSAFGSSVLSVVPYQVKAKGGYQAKVQVRLRESTPFVMFAEGDTLVLEVQQTSVVPEAKAPAAARREKGAAPAVEEVAAARPVEQAGELPVSMTTITPKKVYKGRRVTLEFSDADVRKIFQLIAEVSNLNFLVADDVTGTISIKLVNVPWDQALDVILDAKGLGMQREGNIVQIKPKGKIVTQEEEESLAKKSKERAMELRTAVFEANYASVSDLLQQFAALKSDRGTITKDDRTSKIIVKDIPPAIEEMRNLLKALDTPEKQVMIEARIVEASSNFTRDLGVQWAISYKDASAPNGINSFESSFGGIVSSVLPTTTTGGMATGVSFGKLTSNIQIDMRLSAAATIGQVKIISTPKVVTLNNKAAKISQGQSIPYQTTSAEGTKTEFVEAALTLEVTPHITPDGTVSMKIKASNNSAGAGTPPPINKKEATTELVVANGETTVIGGIYVDSDTEVNTGVPFLADIPLLGWLFKSNTKSKVKTELLIFITPKLVL